MVCICIVCITVGLWFKIVNRKWYELQIFKNVLKICEEILVKIKAIPDLS